MIIIIFKLCRTCKKTILYPQAYCDKCQKEIEEHREELLRIRNKRYNEKRDPKYKAFYNSTEWKVLKDKKMQDEEYRCEECKRLATEVHHIKPIQVEKWWKYRLDYTNLEALCVKCHNERHNRFKKRKERENYETKTNSNR